MRKEQITDKEAICLLTIFLLGSTLLLGSGAGAKQDAWIASLVGLVMAIPMVFIYAKLQALFPGLDFFEILDVKLGKVLGTMLP